MSAERRRLQVTPAWNRNPWRWEIKVDRDEQESIGVGDELKLKSLLLSYGGSRSSIALA